jgi:uncharacterized protein
LAHYIREVFLLDWRGVHGAAHWARVRFNGLRLSRLTGANTKVVELFAFLHDASRENDASDPEHGERAARLARALNGRFFSLSSEELRLLEWACQEHSNGQLRADLSVQVCWDSDRLDLGRIGIRPDPRYLCTTAAQQPRMISAAYQRSRAGW